MGGVPPAGGLRTFGTPGTGSGVAASMSDALQVEVWSDVVCPWCYIGKRRLEAAVQRFDHPVEVTWRSFQLDPSAPAQGGDMASELGRKYGGGRAGGGAGKARGQAG